MPPAVPLSGAPPDRSSTPAGHRFTGIADVAAVLVIFDVNAAMNLLSLLMEHYEQPAAPNWPS